MASLDRQSEHVSEPEEPLDLADPIVEKPGETIFLAQHPKVAKLVTSPYTMRHFCQGDPERLFQIRNGKLDVSFYGHQGLDMFIEAPVSGDHADLQERLM